jgi:hypothetical protein
MMVKPSSAYFWCIALSHGNERRHGTHQEAQKSSTTTLPAYSWTLKVSDARAGVTGSNVKCARQNTASQARIALRLNK